MKPPHQISTLAKRASMIGGFAAVIGALQLTSPVAIADHYTSRPGDNALQRADEDQAQVSTQGEGIRHVYIGKKGAIDLALDSIATTTSTQQMLNPSVTDCGHPEDRL